ncbi:MAG: hypothetical protein QXI97_07500 [Nitrososphaerota archaeon]
MVRDFSIGEAALSSSPYRLGILLGGPLGSTLNRRFGACRASSLLFTSVLILTALMFSLPLTLPLAMLLTCMLGVALGGRLFATMIIRAQSVLPPTLLATATGFYYTVFALASAPSGYLLAIAALQAGWSLGPTIYFTALAALGILSAITWRSGGEGVATAWSGKNHNRMVALSYCVLLIVDDEAFLKLVQMVGGSEGARAVELLLKKPNLSDEELAEMMKVDVKEVRRILHKLNEQGIVSYDIHRDKDTGHRIFKWRVQREQMIGFAKTQMRKLHERLKARLEHEQSHQIYWCGTNGCRKYTFEEAVDQLFKCKTCRKPLSIHDNTELINALKNKIAQLEKSLK